MFKEELLTIVNTWSTDQLTDYIVQLESRITDTRVLIRDLKVLRRKKNRVLYDNGQRGGK